MIIAATGAVGGQGSIDPRRVFDRARITPEKLCTMSSLYALRDDLRDLTLEAHRGVQNADKVHDMLAGLLRQERRLVS